MSDQDFSEATKKEIRKKAMYKCCFCQSLDIEIHHIEPIKEGGSNDISNGAPLCPNCHERYGNDPLKRKRIIEARDAWYERVENMYPDNREVSKQEDMSVMLRQVLQRQISVDDFKHMLNNYNEESYNRMNEMIRNMTMGTVVTTASGIANAGLSSSSSFSPSSSSSSSSSPSPSPEPPEEEQID